MNLSLYGRRIEMKASCRNNVKSLKDPQERFTDKILTEFSRKEKNCFQYDKRDPFNYHFNNIKVRKSLNICRALSSIT